MRKILRVGVVGLVFAVVFLLAPISGDGAVKGGYTMTHYERSTEIFIIFSSGLTDASSSSGFDGRIDTWGIYINSIFSNTSIFLLGVGLGSGSSTDWSKLGVAHNMILDTWALSGLVGVIFFLIFISYVISDLRRLLKATPEGSINQIIALSFAASILFMFQWLLFQPSTGDRSFMIVFYLLAGLLKPTTRWLQENSIIVRK